MQAIRLNLETCKLGSAEDKYMLVSYTTDYWFSWSLPIDAAVEDLVADKYSAKILKTESVEFDRRARCVWLVRWEWVGMKTVRIFFDRIRDRIRLEGF
jgi:hypothetical protein